MKRITGVILSAVWLSGLAASLWAQSRADPWAQVKQDARTSENNQRSPAAQARLQQWFVAKVRAYQDILSDTALGKANPRIIDLGDFTSHLRQILAPPTGTGSAVILFSDEVGTASTMEDTMDILFPRGRADDYIDRHFETCWHEFQHPITIRSERNGRPVAARLEDWRLWRKPPIDADAEHIYIESLGEYMVEWLDYLLHEKSVLRGGGPGLAFEKHCQDAYTQMKEYRARNESISYAVENYCWAKAHEAWIRGWQEAGKLTAPMPRSLREDYRQIHGVWIGFTEDIIRYYMEGGLTAADGQKIRVPEWVMWPDPMKSGILIGHLNEKKEIQQNALRYGFDLRILETYRRRERSDSLNHGSVTVSIENPDSDAKLELALDGKPLRRSAASGKIDLTGFKKDSRIRITFLHGNLRSLAGSRRYKILVDYKDEPRLVNGTRQPSFYYDSRAIYYVDVRGTGASASSGSARPSGDSPTKPGGKPSAQNPSTGRWVLSDTLSSKRVDDMWLNQKQYRFDADVSPTEITFETVYTDAREPERSFTERTLHRWNHPGQVLTPGTPIPVTITVSDNGSENVDSVKSGMNAHSFLFADTRSAKSQYGFGVFIHPASGGPDSNGGGVMIAPGLPRQTKAHTVKVPVRDAKPGDQFTIRIESMQGPTMTVVQFIYTFEQKGREPDAKADAILTAEEPAPEPDPGPMDNEPPKPGDVVKVKEVKETREPGKASKQPSERWYAHAEGDYRFRLPEGWRVSEKSLLGDADSEFDTLWSPDEEIAVVCGRKHTSPYSDTAMKSAVKGIVKDNAKAKVEYFDLGQAGAGSVGQFSREDQVMSWQVVFHHRDRGYLISVNMHTSSEQGRMPDPPARMLKSLQMLR